MRLRLFKKKEKKSLRKGDIIYDQNNPDTVIDNIDHAVLCTGDEKGNLLTSHPDDDKFISVKVKHSTKSKTPWLQKSVTYVTETEVELTCDGHKQYKGRITKQETDKILREIKNRKDRLWKL